MTFRISEDGGAATVFLTGDIDLETSPLARQTLLKAVDKGLPVVVDMGGVSYMDSSGIASLVEAFQRAKTAGHEFSLVRVGGAVQKVLALARLDKVFRIL
ncbi:anti-sigma factor antagonist [Solimonas sp. K1W22B-7]|uniref:STAS domain-containing protein n=1 Tax=Solimonas sp. K1W22B-7 TaxID=2303331 RepID=UPI000E33749A|nr:STAS domain-containing protein [Solimonas sp. K1W22B-7]AXQ29760.1 anti-sigma factor antagonist [Solimonas sp. K1W22B-7]